MKCFDSFVSYWGKIIWSLIQSFLFISGMGMGVWLAIFSSNWLGVWAGLELNSFCFIPFINVSFKFQKEAGMKYFLIQTFGSYMMLFSGLFFTEYYSLFSLVVSLSLLMKSGVAPFHYWYVSMVEELSWFEYLVLSTVQKLGPLFILFYLGESLSGLMMYVVIVLSGFIGAVGGMNEFSLRKLFAYSSIHNMGWILVLLVEGSEMWLIFLFFYFFILSVIIFNMWYMGVYNLNQMASYKYFLFEKINIIVSVLSLGGLPPLVGFFPKFFLLHMSFSFSLLLCLFMLIASSVVMLFIYLRLSYSFMFIMTLKKKSFTLKKNHLLFFSVFGLGFNFFGFFMMSWLFIYVFGV